MDSVPQELVDSIISHLKNDAESLKACSLVSRSFLSSSQEHIFGRVRLAPPTPANKLGRKSDNTCDKFYSLLVASPAIAPLVKELTIDTGDSKPWSRPWEATSTKLADVLQLLPSLQGISLVYAAYFSSLKWQDLPPQFRQCLLAMAKDRLRSLSFTGISFSNYAEFSSVFDGCSQLFEVTLSSVLVFQTVDLPPASAHRPCLRTLSHLGRSYRNRYPSWLSKASSFFDLSQLYELSADIASTDDAVQIWTILADSNSTLKHLSLWFSYDRSFTQFELPDLSQLSTVSFHMMIESYEQLSDLVSWMCSVFERLGSLSVMKQLHISLDCMFIQSPFFLNIPEWARIDDCLSRPELTCLDVVIVDIKATRDMWGTGTILAESFPKLESLGILKTKKGSAGRVKML